MLLEIKERTIVNQYRLVDEITKCPLEKYGQLREILNPHTQEVVKFAFEPFESGIVSSYYPATRDGNTLRFRPCELSFGVRCSDKYINTFEVKNVNVTSTGKIAEYLAKSKRWILPSPSQAGHLDDVELKIESEGYKPQITSLEKIVHKLYLREPIKFELDRTHTNVIIVWPTSRHMESDLGKEFITRGKVFLETLQKELQSELGKLGYDRADVYLLRAKLTESNKEFGNLSYTAADNPLAMIPVDIGPRYSVYEDANYRDKFGHHTVVVACIPTSCNFPPTASIRKVPKVLHVHAVGIAPENDDPKKPGEFAINFLQTSFDSYTIVQSSTAEKLKEKAKLVADELSQELKRKYEMPENLTTSQHASEQELPK